MENTIKNLYDIEAIAPGIYSEVGEVIAEIFARLPYGEEIQLSNGRTFKLAKVGEPSEVDGRWDFMFDARFESGRGPDHIEFTVRHTGGGGFMAGDSVSACPPAEPEQ